MLAVDVAAVRERHCAAAVVSGGGVFAACVKTGDAILNKVFDSDITLLASCVIADDNSCNYEPTAPCNFFVHFAVVQ